MPIKKRNITKYHLIVLIIWRSLVQTQAGPRRKSSTYEKSQVLFLCLRKQCVNIFWVSTWVYIQKQLRLTIAEAIIKSSCAILASSVAVWEPGLC